MMSKKTNYHFKIILLEHLMKRKTKNKQNIYFSPLWYKDLWLRNVLIFLNSLPQIPQLILE